MPRDSTPIATGKPPDTGKTRLLSLADLDKRTRAAQRAKELCAKVLAERGGADRVDALRAVHAETWAVLTALIEDQFARILLGEDIELSSVVALVNSRRREGEAIGQPEPRDVTPDLQTYLREKYSTGNADAQDSSNGAA